ncbi:MAG TPA: TetR/AcrR family transcriptional regulator [Nocardioides sp.]|uniref:TetR/AcrR family transcriptional regulator n=1 Tax=Nocardioides sp. TaxID=35761 RepID=UPI002CFE9FEF|nr:TetR/AcrR family transcriptional regulator [Nocardioides sp.]HTW15833.1 TetR/AcrR family transcriptional regulator [Nocardioides sp.]
MTDPRVLRSRGALLEAALDELAAAGYAAFSMESVAARAGVGRSTLYRHWNDRLQLIADALETLNVQPGPPDDAPAQEPEWGHVEKLLRHLARALTDSAVSRCLPALVHAAEQDAGVREFLQGYSLRRRQALVSVIADGIARGEFRSGDPETMADALSGAVFYRRLMTGLPVAPGEVPGLVAAVLGDRMRRPDRGET